MSWWFKEGREEVLLGNLPPCMGVGGGVFGLCVEVFGRIRIHGTKKDIHSMYIEGIS